MKSASYIVNNIEYLDAYMIRIQLDLTKSEWQHLQNVYPFPASHTIKIQNKKLYSNEALTEYLEAIIKSEETKRQLKG